MAEEQEGAKVKIVCPSCGGSFKGRLPAKPARGTCPRCQKDLVLLPTGAIDTETQFRRKKEDAKAGVPPVSPVPPPPAVPAGATPAAPAPMKEEQSPMFHPTGDAVRLPKVTPPPVPVQDRKKDYIVAAALLLIGWILTGALGYLREKPQVVELGTIGNKGLGALQEKISGK